MKVRKNIMVLLLAAILAGCDNKVDPNLDAWKILDDSRSALNEGNFAESKALIDTLRKRFPMALNAREDAILLLDSINLAEARVELDTCMARLNQPDLSRIAQDTLNFNLDEAQQKVRFFEKKLDHDISNRQKH